MRSPITDTHVVSFTQSRAKRVALFLSSVSVLLTVGAAAVHGQSALDGFDPNANGAVRVVVVQSDGKILIGGDFTSLSPNGGGAVTRNHIARLNPDGTLDAAFDPNANDTVRAIAVQGDGKILAAGDFSGANSIGGQTRNRIARLDPITGLADSFDPNANGSVNAIAVQADGKILVGSGLQSIGGQMRNYIARVDGTTGLADSFDPNSNNLVLSIAVQADGKILVGGAFSAPNSIGGQARNHIARLDPTTGLADSFDPNAQSLVYSIAVQADGKILAGGSFIGANSIGGQMRNRIARLDATTGLADSFNPNANNSVNAIAVQSDGKVLAGGNFNGANSIGGQTRNYIARLDPATGLADAFDPNAGSGVPFTSIYSIAVQADGKVLAGGAFTTLAPNGGAVVSRNFIARLETDGRLDQTLNLGIVGSLIYATAVQPDGKILIGGTFSNVLGTPRNSIARLNVDGTLDAAFNPNANNIVYAIALQADGKVLVGGDFNGANSIGGQTRNRIARLDPVTGAADSFNPNANFTVFTIVVQSDGKILVGGIFNNTNSIGGATRNRIARLDPTTGLADSFNPNANGFVRSLAVQADGRVWAGGDFLQVSNQVHTRIARLNGTTGVAEAIEPNANGGVSCIVVQPDGLILVGGDFFNIGGQIRNRLARLDPVTGLADSFAPIVGGSVSSIAVQADGKIVVGGFFSGASSLGGQTRNRIGRIDGTTGLADSFNPNANGFFVYSVGLQADGKILAGGDFTNIGGQPRTFFARLSNDAAALQDVAVGPTSVTWTRGGASPKFERVSFAQSTDGVNYTPLGNGTPSGSNWTLTGLGFFTEQNFYIRARGSSRSGYQTGSEGIAESVRNAYLRNAPLQLATAVSRKTHGGAGDFDIPLPLAGEPGVECRSSAGAHTLVATFTNNVVSGTASVTAGTGGVSGSPTFAANTMTVNLTSVADVQKITVTLSGVTDSFAQVLPDTAVSMNVLAGDTNGNKSVSASDIGQTKAQSGIPVTGVNFRQDVTPNGTINASDIGLVKSRSGQSVP